MNSDCLVFDSQPYADNDKLTIYVSLSMVWDWLTLELMIIARVLIVSPIGTQYPTVTGSHIKQTVIALHREEKVISWCLR
jgi:hypothetical protein